MPRVMIGYDKAFNVVRHNVDTLSENQPTTTFRCPRRVAQHVAVRHCHNIRLPFACAQFRAYMVHSINSGLFHKKSFLVSEVTRSPSKT
jgi:hypothetical protein